MFTLATSLRALHHQLFMTRIDATLNGKNIKSLKCDGTDYMHYKIKTFFLRKYIR
jgi:hypothetical protein